MSLEFFVGRNFEISGELSSFKISKMLLRLTAVLIRFRSSTLI